MRWWLWLFVDNIVLTHTHTHTYVRIDVRVPTLNKFSKKAPKTISICFNSREIKSSTNHKFSKKQINAWIVFIAHDLHDYLLLLCSMWNAVCHACLCLCTTQYMLWITFGLIWVMLYFSLSYLQLENFVLPPIGTTVTHRPTKLSSLSSIAKQQQQQPPKQQNQQESTSSIKEFIDGEATTSNTSVSSQHQTEAIATGNSTTAAAVTATATTPPTDLRVQNGNEFKKQTLAKIYLHLHQCTVVVTIVQKGDNSNWTFTVNLNV